MKECTKCYKVKELNEFDVKSTGYIYNYCKDCRRKYIREHYNKNKDYYLKKAKRNKTVYVQEFMDYKKTLSCTDCGISFEKRPWLCDFHHIDNSKEYEVASLKQSKSKRIEEIKKCVPLCANCHRTRHNASIV